VSHLLLQAGHLIICPRVYTGLDTSDKIIDNAVQLDKTNKYKKNYDTIRYDTIGEFIVDSKAQYSSLI